jgi:hypothetical protein
MGKFKRQIKHPLSTKRVCCSAATTTSKHISRLWFIHDHNSQFRSTFFQAIGAVGGEMLILWGLNFPGTAWPMATDASSSDAPVINPNNTHDMNLTITTTFERQQTSFVSRC